MAFIPGYSKYKGTIALRKNWVYKNSAVINNTLSQRYTSRWENEEIKIPVLTSNFLSQFTAKYFQNDSSEDHPYYYFDATEDTKLDFENMGITFIAPEKIDNNMGIIAYRHRLVSGNADGATSQPVETDLYGIGNSATYSSSGSTRNVNSIFMNDTYGAYNDQYRAIFPNIIDQIKTTYTVNSDKVKGIKCKYDSQRDAYLALDTYYSTYIYYKDYQGSGVEGPYMNCYGSGLTGDGYKFLIENTEKGGYAGERAYYYPSRIKQQNNTYTNKNLYFPFYSRQVLETFNPNTQIWTRQQIMSTRNGSLMAFLVDDAGVIYCLTGFPNDVDHADTETTRYINNGNHIEFYLFRVQDIPSSIGGGASTNMNVIPSSSASWLSVATYALNDTFEEMLFLEPDEGGEPGPEPGEDPWEDQAESETGGGNGTLDWTSTPVESVVVEDPEIIGTSAMNVYRVDKYSEGSTYTTKVQNAMGYLYGFLWSNQLKNVIKDSNDSAKNCIVSLHILPIEVTYGSDTSVVLGNIGYEIGPAGEEHYFQLPRVTSQFQTINMGTISLDEFWGGYPDYAPYTNIQIFLPFIGYKSLNVNEVMGRSLNLKYTFDILTGECVAILYIKQGNEWYNAYEWNGQCALSYPVSAAQYTQKMAAVGQMVGGAIQAAAGFATGQDLKALQGLTQVGKGIMQSNQHSVTKEGSLAGSPGWMGGKQPFITIESPRISQAKKKIAIQGDKINRSMLVSECSGFTVFDTIHLESVHATKEEKDLLTQMLQGGIII